MELCFTLRVNLHLRISSDELYERGRLASASICHSDTLVNNSYTQRKVPIVGKEPPWPSAPTAK